MKSLARRITTFCALAALAVVSTPQIAAAGPILGTPVPYPKCAHKVIKKTPKLWECRVTYPRPPGVNSVDDLLIPVILSCDPTSYWNGGPFMTPILLAPKTYSFTIGCKRN